MGLSDIKPVPDFVQREGGEQETVTYKQNFRRALNIAIWNRRRENLNTLKIY